MNQKGNVRLIVSICIGVIIVFSGTIIYLLAANRLSLIGGNSSIKNPPVASEPTKQPMTEKIISSEVTVEDCKIKLNTTKGDILLTTEYSKSYPETKCYQFLLNKVSPSGRYAVFQDISGGLDSALRIYSLEYNENIQLNVFGTSKIFDISFLPDDKLISLSGYEGIYNEQSLTVFDLSGLFADYPSNIDEQYKYFTNLNLYEKNITLPDIGKDYSSLAVSDGVLKIYGTGGVNAGILKEYNFNELTAESTPNPAETANWKTYTNNKYLFAVKYPDNWTAIESVSPKTPYLANITFGPTKTIQQGGSFGLAVRNQTGDEYLASLKKEGFAVVDSIITTIGGKEATAYTFTRNDTPKSQWKEVVAQNDNVLFVFSSGANSDQENIFDQMFSTFKFIGNEETSDWKTYIKNDFNFSFKYPNEFILTDAAFRNEIYLYDYLGRFGQEIGMLALSKSAYPKNTDLTRADILIAVNRDVSGGEYFFQAVDKNQGVPPLEIESLSPGKTVVIKGITWGMAEKNGAAAGTHSRTRIYHTFQNGIWYEVQLNLWTASDGSITPVNENDIWDKLESILPTFKFTK